MLPCSLDVCLHLSASLVGGVRLLGCLSSHVSELICFPVWLVASGSLEVCLHLFAFICLPAWLVVSGSHYVCLYLPPGLAGCARLSGCLPLLVSQCLAGVSSSVGALLFPSSLVSQPFGVQLGFPEHAFCWHQHRSRTVPARHQEGSNKHRSRTVPARPRLPWGSK